MSKPLFPAIVLGVILLFSCHEINGQYFQFSLSSFSGQRINPAYPAMSDYASADFLYRQQRATENFNIKSSLVSLSMPFIKANGGQRWSGIGLTFMDDRSGQNGIFKVQEVGLSYAVRVRVAYNQSLYFGVRSLYETRAFSLEGMYTGTQYIPGRGFNSSISSGETPDDFRQQFVTFSTGLMWEATTRNGTPLAYAGFALYDINKVDQAFFNGESVAPLTAVIDGRLHLSGPTQLSLDPVALITFGQRTDVNVGAIWNYKLSSGSVGLITRYVVGRYAIAGLEYARDNLALGFSYDVPIHSQISNQGSIEFGIKLKRLVKSKIKERKPADSDNIPSPVPESGITDIPIPETIARKIPYQGEFELRRITPKPVVFYKSSEKNKARAGDLLYYPYVNENSILKFHYDLNSTVMSSEARQYLEDIADLLIDNPQIRILINGHTDSLGSDAYNLVLSQERADRIRDFLISQGVDGKRIQAHGRGEEEPIDSNSTEKGRSKNRRVEFKMLR